MGYSRGYADTLSILDSQRRLAPTRRLAVAVALHLESNLFPPVPATPDLVNALGRAIRNMARGREERRVRLPHQPSQPSWRIVEAFRLAPLVAAWHDFENRQY